MIPSPADLAGGLLDKQNGPNDSGRSYDLSAFMYKTDKGEWVVVPADVIPRYNVNSVKDYTEIPIEGGGFASEHAILRPQIFDLTLHATETPILWYKDGFEAKELRVKIPQSEFKAGGYLALTQGVSKVINAGLDLLGVGSSDPGFRITTLQGPGKGGRINALYEQLLTAFYNSYECKLVVNGRAYDSIFITAIQNTRDGAAVLGTFNVTCKEVIFVTTGKSKLRLDPASGRNNKKADAGKKAPEQKPELKSDLARMQDATGFGL